MAPRHATIALVIRYVATCYKRWAVAHMYGHRCRTPARILHAPGMRKRCVCAVFRSGGLSGNARAAMPRRGGRSQPAPSPHDPRPLYPRPVWVGSAGHFFRPFLQGGRGTERAPQQQSTQYLGSSKAQEGATSAVCDGEGG